MTTDVKNKSIISPVYGSIPTTLQGTTPITTPNEDAASIRTQLPPYIPAPSYTPNPALSFAPHGVLGIYHCNRSDYFISAHAKDPSHLYFAPAIRTVKKPHITLHPGNDASSIPIASAKLRPYGVDVDVAPNEDGSMGARGVVPVYEKGVVRAVRYFNVAVAGSHVPERFEWRRSSGELVKGLRGKTSGWECVRVGTGEVVAVWVEAWVMAINKIGKFRIVERVDGGTVGGWGEDVEKLVVMTLLAKAEEARRDAVGVYDASASGMTSAKSMPE